MASSGSSVVDPRRVPGGARTAGSTSPKGPARYVVVARRLLCAAVVCLLFAGCSTVGGSWRSPAGGWKRLPAWIGLNSREKAFAEAVERDPFPAADQADLKVGVSR